MVETMEALEEVIAADPAFSAPSSDQLVAIDCEGVPERLDLIQVATAQGVYVMDCVKIPSRNVCTALEPLLRSRCTKLFHDLHKDAYALVVVGGVDAHDLCCLLDTQLAAEHLYGEVFVGFNALLAKLSCAPHPTKYAMKAKMQQSESYFSKRPLSQQDIEYAALDAVMLLEAWPRLEGRLGDDTPLLIDASMGRAASAIAHDGARSITFDVTDDFAVASAELLKATRPDDAFKFQPLVPEVDAADIIELLPRDLRTKLQPPPAQHDTHREQQPAPFGWPWIGQQQRKPGDVQYVPLDLLSDIVIDVGRRPQCWVGSDRIFLADTDQRVGTRDDINFVTQQVGGFGSDNRAGLDGKLHRISAMINRDQRTSGLTMRLGRSVKGNADMVIDLLLGSDKSILVLGEPGSGKTTIIREATRQLAERMNVVVVDTSNEIAGDGLVPHPCIGLARRMMVRSLDEQSAVMIECVQNHTPHVMVIDEIGRPKEVKAARTCKQRGVRLLASAHGDLRKLLKNGELNGLLGGIESIVMGDAMAKEEAMKRGGKGEVSKIKVQRTSEPTFDAIVEVRRGALHEWRVVLDTAAAVDAILDRGSYKVQERKRDPRTGDICLELMHA